MSKLQIIQDSSPRPRGRLLTSRIRERAVELQAQLDRQWLLNGEDHSYLEKLRVERLTNFIKANINVAGLMCVDLGCGTGCISAALRDAGAEVLAVDLSSKALALLRERHGEDFPTRQDLVPHCNLEDDSYDLVIATDVVAELDSREYPLLMSELYRLVKPNGWVVASTPIDIYSSDALQRFQALVERDFKVHTWTYSSHRLLIQLTDSIKALSRLKNSARCIRAAESFSKWFWADAAISHSAFIGQRRPLGSS